MENKRRLYVDIVTDILDQRLTTVKKYTVKCLRLATLTGNGKLYNT